MYIICGKANFSRLLPLFVLKQANTLPKCRRIQDVSSNVFVFEPKDK